MKHRVMSLLPKQFIFIALAAVYSVLAIAEPNTCPDDAQKYWGTFRGAVLRGDMKAVSNATRFPFAINRTLDESEARNIDCKEFIKALPELLAVDPGLSPTPTTMKSFLKATPRLSQSSCNSYGNQFRVGTWVFELTPVGWLFVQAFVDE